MIGSYAEIQFPPTIGHDPELPTIIQEVNANLAFSVTNSLNPGMNYYVCFDELDLGFSVTDKNYRLRLIGLLLAARKINVAARENEKKLSVLVFLRDDIYNSLQFEDKNKITENASSRIEWDTGGTDRTLKELMERRFSEVLEIPRETAWDAVFDETKEMPGHQKKYQHILDRTFLRPRDIIKSCNEILSVYKARGHEAGDKFQNRDVIDSRAAYSEYLLKELDDEIHKHIPEYKNYIEVIKTLDSLQFEFQDFDSACKERTGILPPDYDPRQILSQLFEFSILGYYKAGGGGYGGAEYVWRYQDPNARFNENAANFRIHPGFKEVLGLKKYTKSG